MRASLSLMLTLLAPAPGCASASDPPLGPQDAPASTADPQDSGAGSETSSGPLPMPHGATGTWTQVYSTYFALGTVGHCAKCHGPMGNAATGYAWLTDKGFIGAPKARLADPEQSCLSWLGGSMPPGGPSANPAAAADLAAWAAAGAPNN